MKIINLKNKINKVINKKNSRNRMKIQKICCICKEKFEDKHANDNKYQTFRDHWLYTGGYRGAVHSICNLRCSITKEIIATFQNGSKMDLTVITKLS